MTQRINLNIKLTLIIPAQHLQSVNIRDHNLRAKSLDCYPIILTLQKMRPLYAIITSEYTVRVYIVCDYNE